MTNPFAFSLCALIIQLQSCLKYKYPAQRIMNSGSSYYKRFTINWQTTESWYNNVFRSKAGSGLFFLPIHASDLDMFVLGNCFGELHKRELFRFPDECHHEHDYKWNRKGIPVCKYYRMNFITILYSEFGNRERQGQKTELKGIQLAYVKNTRKRSTFERRPFVSGSLLALEIETSRQ